MHSRRNFTLDARAFTLVELLVVIAIAGILIALVLPAVQSARASARKTQCANSFKQVALATLNQSSSTNSLPAAHDRHFSGKDIYQIGWKFTILPFLEEQGLYDQMVNASAWEFQKVEETISVRPSVVETFLCPSTPGTPRLYGGLVMVSKHDESVLFDGFATRQIQAPRWMLDQASPSSPDRWEHGAWGGTQQPRSDHSVEDWDRSLKNPAKLRWITDGLSKTILVVEMAGLNEWIVGEERNQEARVVDVFSPWMIEAGGGHVSTRHDISDWAFETKFVDRPVNQSNLSQIYGFHTKGAHVSMCDGSVRLLSDDASAQVVFELGTRDSTVLSQ